MPIQKCEDLKSVCFVPRVIFFWSACGVHLAGTDLTPSKTNSALPCFLCEQEKLWGLKRPWRWAKFAIFYALFAKLVYFSMDAQHSLIENSECPLPRIQDGRASFAFSVWEKSLYWPNWFTCYISFRHTLYLHCPFLRKICHFFSLFGLCQELKSAVFSTHHSARQFKYFLGNKTITPVLVNIWSIHSIKKKSLVFTAGCRTVQAFFNLINKCYWNQHLWIAITADSRTEVFNKKN